MEKMDARCDFEAPIMMAGEQPYQYHEPRFTTDEAGNGVALLNRRPSKRLGAFFSSFAAVWADTLHQALSTNINNPRR